MKKILISALIPLILLSGGGKKASAQEKTLEAIVVRISEETSGYQRLELKVTQGDAETEIVAVENGNIQTANYQRYQINDRVVVSVNEGPDGNKIYYIADFVRRESLGWLFAGFVILTILVAKWRGAMSILGMVISFGVIFWFILPGISSGWDPVATAIIGSLIIIPATFYFSHGFNKKTMVAVVGTLISLVITGLLAGIAVEAAKLSGFSSEEAGFLQVVTGGAINIRGLLLAGIIIGVLGVMDDITVSQSAVVFQLKEASPKIKFDELYKRAMNVGQDHISSMVNTLVLVYTGASLPLLLLFVDNPKPFSEIVNYEIIADEIVRTLIGSIGLILAVPITTLLAVWVSLQSQPAKRIPRGANV